MGIVKTIYLDDETSKALEDAKKKNPELNLSNLVKEAILKDKEEVKTSEEMVKALELQVLNKMTSVNILNEEIKNLNERIAKVNEKINKEKEKDQTLQERKERMRKIDFDSILDSFIEFFNLDLETATTLTNEFIPLKETQKKTIFQFMKENHPEISHK